jgi:hypothetical protein
MDDCWRVVDAIEILLGDDAYSIQRRASRRSRKNKLGAGSGPGVGKSVKKADEWHIVGAAQPPATSATPTDPAGPAPFVFGKPVWLPTKCIP